MENKYDKVNFICYDKTTCVRKYFNNVAFNKTTTLIMLHFHLTKCVSVSLLSYSLIMALWHVRHFEIPFFVVQRDHSNMMCTKSLQL